jgi:hypothetical protein
MDIDTGFTKEGTFLFAMHAHLAKDYGVAIRDPWQGYIQRLRHIILDRGYAGESNVHLIMSPDTEMGDGLNPSTVSIIPDPSLGVTFGSVPDQMIISDQCPCWQHVSKRVYQNKTGTLGAKPHYVLAHLLNHQLNGPGNNRLNVLPFWATANTEMSQKAETPVKKAVSQGLVVTYSIVTGDAMKLDPEYWKWVDGVLEDTNLSQEIRDILEWEMELPQYLVITATGRDGAGNDHDLLGGPQRINNFVPMTIPVLKTPLKPKAKAKK